MPFTRLLMSLLLLIPAGSDGIRSSAIDEYVTGRMRASRIPGLALAVVKDDRVVYLKGYGRADSSGRPVTPQTPFLIGSITKPFTALAVMQLVEAGTIDLDAPVQRYIHWFRVADPDASRRITVRQLLTMTSGLPQLYETQLWTAQDDGALERAVRLLETKALSRPVGAFGYSNSNYETLGVLVQTVTGLSYEDYVKQHIFGPLDMRESFVSQDEAGQHGMAVGHRWWFGIPIPVTLPYNRGELPAGYIFSSADDMSHFLIAQMNGGRYGNVSVLSPDGIVLTHTAPVAGAYAMGWETARDEDRTLVNHDGGTANFQSSLFFDPDARVGVFMAANVLNALDAFASPSGQSPQDGATVRAMARSVLSLAANRPLPAQGRRHERLTFVFDLVIVALTCALVVSVARIPRWRQRLARQGIASWAGVVWRCGTAVVANFSLPAVLLVLALGVPAWKALIVLFEPDLAYWLYAVALVLFFKGLFEIAAIWTVFTTGHPGTTPA